MRWLLLLPILSAFTLSPPGALADGGVAPTAPLRVVFLPEVDKWVESFHDPRGAVCWVAGSTYDHHVAISCLPDSQLDPGSP